MRKVVFVAMLTATAACGSPETIAASPQEGAGPVANVTPAVDGEGPTDQMATQSQLQSELGDAVQHLRDDAQRRFPSVFGGLHWQDKRLKLGFTRDADALRSEVVAGFPRPDLVDSVTVLFSVAELQAIVDRITADSAELIGQGINLASWGVDDAMNRVHVAVDGLSASGLESLHSRYGAKALSVVDRPLTRTLRSRVGD
ncbi:MAG: hypothetical protein ACRDH0_14360 [Actinomycetota bacterium]